MSEGKRKASNVIDLPVISRLDYPAEKILSDALDAGLMGVVVVGYTQDGQEYVATSYADGGDVLWLLRRAEHRLMLTVDEIIAEEQQ